MAKSDITGRRKLLAQNVSHSNIKTKRWQHVNLQTRRIWVPELGGQPRTREYRMLGFNPNSGQWQHQIIADPDNVIRNPSKVGMHGSTVD